MPKKKKRLYLKKVADAYLIVPFPIIFWNHPMGCLFWY